MQYHYQGWYRKTRLILHICTSLTLSSVSVSSNCFRYFWLKDFASFNFSSNSDARESRLFFDMGRSVARMRLSIAPCGFLFSSMSWNNFPFDSQLPDTRNTYFYINKFWSWKVIKYFKLHTLHVYLYKGSPYLVNTSKETFWHIPSTSATCTEPKTRILKLFEDGTWFYTHDSDLQYISVSSHYIKSMPFF